MNIVLDTMVFLWLCAGKEEPSKVYSKIIRDCNKVVLDDRIVEEYTKVLTKEGFNTMLVYTKMTELNLQQKLIYSKKRIQRLENILTHEKDRHLIECAYHYKASIITYEMKYLLDLKTDFKNRCGIEILAHSEYLSLEKGSK